MKHFFIALQFLTILPIKISAIKEKDFGKSLLYFPIIGMFIGFLLALTSFTFSFFPTQISAVLILVVSTLITGAIHLDGFADTCDGFYGSRPKEEILKIMRDSHIGTMGVIGLVGLLFLKFAILIEIPKENLGKSLIMMATFARWSQSLACGISHYARENGKAKYFIEYANRKRIIIGGLFTLGVFLLLKNSTGLVSFIISLITVLLFINYAKRKIGGMTGDTVGATSEIAEAMALLCSVF